MQSLQLKAHSQGLTSQTIAIVAGTFSIVAFLLLFVSMHSANYDFDISKKIIIPNRPGFFMRFMSIPTRSYTGSIFSFLIRVESHTFMSECEVFDLEKDLCVLLNDLDYQQHNQKRVQPRRLLTPVHCSRNSELYYFYQAG